MKPFITYIGVLLASMLLLGCTNRNFQNDQDFKEWINHKKFTSIGNDHEQYHINGSYGSPVGTIEIKISGNLLRRNDNPPIKYDYYKDNDGYVVSFQYSNEDNFNLVIPSTGNCYLKSVAYDLSQMERGSGSAINRLDAIIKRGSVKGPEMEISELENTETFDGITTVQVPQVNSPTNSDLSAYGLIKLYNDTKEGLDTTKSNIYKNKLNQLLDNLQLIDNAILVDSLKGILEVHYLKNGFVLGNTIWSHTMPVNDNFIQFTDGNNKLRSIYFRNNYKYFQNAHYNKIYFLDQFTNKVILLGNIYTQAGESTYAIQYLDLSQPDFGLNSKVFNKKSTFYIIETFDFDVLTVNQLSPNNFRLNANNKTTTLIWNGSEFIVK